MKQIRFYVTKRQLTIMQFRHSEMESGIHLWNPLSRILHTLAVFTKTTLISNIFTGRNEVVAKVMFLQVCVCPQGGEGVCLSACWDAIPPWMENPPGTRQTPQMEEPRLGPSRPPPGWRNHPPPRDQADPPRMEEPPPREADSSIRSTSGRYASYWNAFLSNLAPCMNSPQVALRKHLSPWKKNVLGLNRFHPQAKQQFLVVSFLSILFSKLGLFMK